jgi:hypothetical protein
MCTVDYRGFRLVCCSGTTPRTCFQLSKKHHIIDDAVLALTLSV